MTRLKALSPDEVTGKAKEMFTAVNNKFGVVPNMIRTMGNSPALLEGYLNFSTALDHGTLGAKTNKLIALTVAESNQCNYCLSIHTYLGINLLRIDSEVLDASRGGKANDAKTQAILTFARALISKKGLVNDADVYAVKATGVTEAEVGEIVGQVALNILTNYFNNTANTEIDFPLVEVQNVAVV
jgi:uncharacterized peroxidase-related enzyme